MRSRRRIRADCSVTPTSAVVIGPVRTMTYLNWSYRKSGGVASKRRAAMAAKDQPPTAIGTLILVTLIALASICDRS